MKYIYVGKSSYIDGIPARDLSDAEFDALPVEKQKAVKTCGLYKPVSEAKPESVSGEVKNAR